MNPAFQPYVLGSGHDRRSDSRAGGPQGGRASPANHGTAARCANQASQDQSPWRRFQTTEARANWLCVVGFVNAPPRQPLTLDIGEHKFRAATVMHTQFDAVVVAERELVQLTLEMLLTAVLVNASEAALEHVKEAFNRIGGHFITACKRRSCRRGRYTLRLRVRWRCRKARRGRRSGQGLVLRRRHRPGTGTAT